MKNNFSVKIIILSWIIFLFICLGLLSFTSHAATAGNLPVFVDPENFPIETFSTYLNNQFHFGDIRNNSGSFCYKYSENSYYDIYTFMYPYNNATYTTNITLLDYPNFNINTDTLNITLSVYPYVATNNPVYFVFGVRCNKNTYNINSSWSQNLSNTVTIPFFYGSNNTMVWVADDMFSINSTNQYGLIYTPNAIPADEEFGVPPIFSGLDPGWIGAGAADVVTPPASVPSSITINNYSWTTNNPPSFDNSSVENALESLGDIITYQFSWLSSNLSGEFGNLNTNIKNLIDYVCKTIQYFGDLIIKNIQNGIQNLYDNLKSFLQPIIDKINYISEPVSGTVIYDNISGTSLVGNITTIHTSLTSFQASFSSVSEPSEYKIPIHLENLPVSYFGIQTVQYIDLGVINGSVKDGIRLFVWAMVTYSLVITIFDSISNYINGGGDES